MKKLGVEQFIGKKINSFIFTDDHHLDIFTSDGKVLQIILEDEWYGCNDSYASFQENSLENILGQEIISAVEQNHPEHGDGTMLVFETAQNTAFIKMTHESNGCYGWGYEVFIK